MISEISDDIAIEKARIQDRVVEDFLDKHGLKGKTKPELDMMGYVLERSSENDPFQEYVTYRLYKFVDSTSYKFKVKLDYEPAKEKK